MQTRCAASGADPHPLPYGADYDDSSFDADLPGRAETSGHRADQLRRQARLRAPAAASGRRARGIDGRQPTSTPSCRRLLPWHAADAAGRPASRPPVLTYSTTPLFLTSRDTAPGGTGILPAGGRARPASQPRTEPVVPEGIAARVAPRPPTSCWTLWACRNCPSSCWIRRPRRPADRADHPRVRVPPQRPARPRAIRRRRHPAARPTASSHRRGGASCRRTGPSCTSPRAPSTTPI